MAVAYVNKGTLHAPSSAASCTPPLPASVVAGNLLVAAVFTQGSAGAHTWPAGWTQIDQQSFNSGTFVGSFAYRVATGSDSAPVVSWPSASFNLSQTWQYSGASASPISAARSVATGVSTGTHISASVSTTADGSLVLLLDLSRGSTLLTNPSGWTQDSNAAAGIGCFYFGSKTLTTSGDASGAVSTAGDGTGWVQWQQEILAAPPPPDAASTTDIATTAEADIITAPSGASIATVGSSADASNTTSPTASSEATASTYTDATGIYNPSVSSEAITTGAASAIWKTFVTASSTADFVTTCSAPTIFWEVVTTGITFDGTILGTRLIDATITGTVTINGVPVGSASYHVSAASEVQIQDGVQFVQDFWDGWAFNLNTGAPSAYEDFKFNSFARIGSNYYGCNDTGIYLLGGELDVAAEIDATVTTGYSDLSTDKFDGGQIKHVTTAYLDARTATPMTITCRTEGQEYTYTFDTDRTNMASARAMIGKGLKGTLWQFELKNVAGSDFEAESLTVLVDPTKRRA